MLHRGGFAVEWGGQGARVRPARSPDRWSVRASAGEVAGGSGRRAGRTRGANVKTRVKRGGWDALPPASSMPGRATDLEPILLVSQIRIGRL